MLLVYGESKKGDDHIENEDSILIDKEKKLFAVADGVSIPQGGGIASRLFLKYLPICLRDSLKEAFKCANKKILEERKKLMIGYTTCTSIWIKNKEAEIANVGDSPAFLIRDGKITLLNEIDRSFDGSLLQAIGDTNIIVHSKLIELKTGDLILLMTDGISDVLPSQKVLEIVSTCKELKKLPKMLVEAASKAVTFYNDDKTVIVIKYE